MKVLAALVFLAVSVIYAQDEPPAPPAPRPVGVKITRPAVVGIAGTPPVGGTLVTYGYSWEEPATGSALQGITSFYEQTVQKHISLFVSTTEPLVRAGKLAIGDTCPGFKIRSGEETRWRPVMAVFYSVKVPVATTGFGTGLYDHKVTLAADKGIGRTRWTGNFSTTWAGQKNGTYLRQYQPSLSALTRWHRRGGSILQAYWTTAGKHYGGFVAAPFIQVNSAFNFFAGGVRNVGPCTTRYGIIAGFNYMHRPRR
jgi:hypothetical protein